MREQILKVHMQRVPLSEDVDASIIARGSPGFSGADLENIVNEAALFAARGGKKLVEMIEFEKAKDKIMMGAERKSMVMSEKEKRNTAFHESGHAIVGRSVPEFDKLYKITIVPRGRALGLTQFLPDEDRYSMSRMSIKSQIMTLFGGRIAEEMVNGPDGVTTGASNDIERASQLARNMVTKWGLSERMGPLLYDEEDREVFLGMSAGTQPKSISAETAREIDEEVRKIIDDCYAAAKAILTEHEDKLYKMADALVELETLTPEQADNIMAGAKPRVVLPPDPPPPTEDKDDSQPDPDAIGDPSFCEGRVKPKRRRRFAKWARRWKYGAKATRAGELVQVDHMTYTCEGRTLKEFRAVCPVSRFMVARVFTRATAGNARRFLGDLVGALPFPVLSIQVNGGSDVHAP